MMRDAELIEAMDQISRVGGVAVVHAENGDIVAEVIIIISNNNIIIIIFIRYHKNCDYRHDDYSISGRA